MMRMLRITAIVVFALLLGFSAHSLRKMQQSGELFERYNSQRKADITLFGVSLIALLGLSAFEVTRLKKSSGTRRYGERRYTEEAESEAAIQPTSCIYSSRKSVDDWPGRRITGSRTAGNRAPRSLPETWMTMLRIICLVLPCVNIVLFSLLYLGMQGNPNEQWVIPTLCSVFVVLAVATAIGIFNRQAWGLSVGYLTAIINLVLFPIGTAMGLLLLIGLVGASSIFAEASRKTAKRVRGGMAA